MLDLNADRYGTKELVINAVVDTQVWHRGLGHLHAQSLDILRERDGTGITFEGAVLDCGVCAVGKAQQLAHLKTANHKINQSFQLSYVDLIGSFKPVALGGYKYVSKIIDEYINWTAVDVLTNKNQDFQSLQLIVDSTSILFGCRFFRWCADKGDENAREKFGSSAWRPVLSNSSPPPTCRSKLVCLNAWGELCGSWFGACSQIAAFHRPCGGSCSWRRRTSRTGLRIRCSRWRRIQGASRRGSRPFAPSRHWSQSLRVHKGLQEARRRGLGREGVRL